MDCLQRRVVKGPAGMDSVNFRSIRKCSEFERDIGSHEAHFLIMEMPSCAPAEDLGLMPDWNSL